MYCRSTTIAIILVADLMPKSFLIEFLLFLSFSLSVSVSITLSLSFLSFFPSFFLLVLSSFLQFIYSCNHVSSTVTFSILNRGAGYFKNDLFDGYGVRQGALGGCRLEGIWKYGQLSSPTTVNSNVCSLS